VSDGNNRELNNPHTVEQLRLQKPAATIAPRVLQLALESAIFYRQVFSI